MLTGDTKYWCRIVAVAAVVLGLQVLASAETVPPEESLVFPRHAVPFGHTYSERAAQWQQWALSIPVSTHPLFDHGDCRVGQTGKVFFLGARVCSNTDDNCDPKKVARACSVPTGKALFFPVVNAQCSTLEGEGNGCAATVEENRTIVKALIDGTANLSAEIDEVPIPNLQQFREQSPPFSFTLPADNLLTAIGEGPFSAGTYFPAVDDGIYLMVRPLSVGHHMLHWHGEFPDFNVTFDVTYQLTVTPQ
jgi:hypothetical protein